MSKKQPSGGKIQNLKRRDFLKQAGFSTLGGALSFSLADGLIAQQSQTPAAPPKTPYETLNQVEGMGYVPLGKTNLMVSRMALGGTPWQPMVAKKAISMGVNLVHCANGYGTMEKQVETLQNDWNKFWYALKYDTNHEKTMAEAIEICFRTIKQDHIDFILPTVYNVKTANYAKLKEEFEALKKAGKVRFLGATLHTRSGKDLPAICGEVIDSGIFDLILTMYQVDNKPGLDKELARAVENNIGTMSMKTLTGAKADQFEATFKAALAGGTIHTILKGLGDMANLNTFAKIAGQTPMPPKPAVTQAKPCLDPNVCGGCGECTGCPQHIEIPEIMRYATYYAPMGLNDFAARSYRDLPVHNTVAACIDCGLCERQCPRAMAIRKTLRWAHQQWA
jgi:predicted aldo/keto reductase-like oxidoreductase